LRSQIGALPGHVLTEERLFELSRGVVAVHNHAALEAPPLDAFFSRIKLKDNSETQVGFWVYAGPEKDSEPTFLIVCMLLAHDPFPETPAAVRASREKERFAWLDRYDRILWDVKRQTEQKSSQVNALVPRQFAASE
jgi:hypothetical protein